MNTPITFIRHFHVKPGRVAAFRAMWNSVSAALGGLGRILRAVAR